MTSFRTSGRLWPILGVCAGLGVSPVYAANDGASSLSGTWTAQRDGERTYLQLSHRPGWQHGFKLASSALERTDTGLRLSREAGAFDLVGLYDGERGGGTYTFIPSESFRQGLSKLGFDRVTDSKMVELAAMDLTLDFIRELRKLGFKEGLRRYVEMRIHGATPAYVRALVAAGYKGLSAKRLVQMRIHGVTPEYIEELKAAGYTNISARRLVEMRIHGVSVDFIKGMAKADYANLDAKRLVEMRIHGVSVEFARRMRAEGLDPTAKDLVEMRIHGVSPDYVAGLKRRGLKDISVRRAVEFRIHGVDEAFISEMGKLGYGSATPRELIDMRIHGVAPDWVRRVQAKLTDRPTARELIELRIHGFN